MALDLSPAQREIWGILTSRGKAQLIRTYPNWRLKWTDDDGVPHDKSVPSEECAAMGYLLKPAKDKTKGGGTAFTANLHCTDPLEKAIEIALIEAGIRYHTETDAKNGKNLDFFLPDLDIYLEVKSGHTDRIAEQMSRHPNVIAIQGGKSTRWIAALIQSLPT